MITFFDAEVAGAIMRAYTEVLRRRTQRQWVMIPEIRAWATAIADALPA
jgi:hypothetical protein